MKRVSIPVLGRRQFVASTIAGLGVLSAPGVLFARAPGEKRLVFVIQRGAADGLATLAPVGESRYQALRGGLADGPGEGLRIGGLFELHPALARIGGLYGEGQALFAHAVGTAYRDRSHFDGQNVLETGGAMPYQLRDGWLNRLLPLLPQGDARALALAPAIPAALRGSAEVTSYAPSNLPEANSDLLDRVSQLYAADPQLHALWEEALATRMMAEDSEGDGRNPAELGTLAASLMAPANGARVAMIETTGWDTHTNQQGRLQRQLAGLDAMVGALKDGLGPLWASTLVIVATEFGRTAAVNGTQGTDHGTGSLAMMLGGAVRGGRVIGEWPGLAGSALYENRDLAPVNAMEALLGGALGEFYGIEPGLIAGKVFPAERGRPAEGLIA